MLQEGQCPPIIETRLKRCRTWQSLPAIFCVCVCGVIASFSLSGSDDDTKQLVQWGRREWIESSCNIKAAGVAYRGTCEYNMTTIDTQFTDYTECKHAMDVRAHREDTDFCTHAGDEEFLSPGASGDRASSSMKFSAPQRALRSWRQYRLNNCWDTFLLWALVGSVHPLPANKSDSEKEVEDMKHLCAYEYGAASVSTTDDWEGVQELMHVVQAASELKVPVPCWKLPDSTCVLALKHPSIRSMQQLEEDSRNTFIGTLCGATAICICSASVLCVLFQPSCDFIWQRMQPSRDYFRVPAAEPPSDETCTVLAKKIVNTAVKNIGEETPFFSIEPSHRQHDAVNLAHDLLY
mmetsp:Transcript_101709/g.195232  ORF Transcript_101709/g.195232 Transcript_101709/m.195232 type:complete len:350 (+) Transcript_101709:215-1264(+)